MSVEFLQPALGRSTRTSGR